MTIMISKMDMQRLQIRRGFQEAACP
jgi:hypothetical protein